MNSYEQLLKAIRKNGMQQKRFNQIITEADKPEGLKSSYFKSKFQEQAEQSVLPTFYREKETEATNFERKCFQLQKQNQRLAKQIADLTQSINLEAESLKRQLSERINQLERANARLDQTFRERDDLLEQLQSIGFQLRNYESLLAKKNSELKALQNMLQNKDKKASWQRVNGLSYSVESKFRDVVEGYTGKNQVLQLISERVTRASKEVQCEGSYLQVGMALRRFVRVCREQKMSKRLESSIKELIRDLTGEFSGSSSLVLTDQSMNRSLSPVQLNRQSSVLKSRLFAMGQEESATPRTPPPKGEKSTAPGREAPLTQSTLLREKSARRKLFQHK